MNTSYMSYMESISSLLSSSSSNLAISKSRADLNALPPKNLTRLSPPPSCTRHLESLNPQISTLSPQRFFSTILMMIVQADCVVHIVLQLLHCRALLLTLPNNPPTTLHSDFQSLIGWPTMRINKFWDFGPEDAGCLSPIPDWPMLSIARLVSPADRLPLTAKCLSYPWQ